MPGRTTYTRDTAVEPPLVVRGYTSSGGPRSGSLGATTGKPARAFASSSVTCTPIPSGNGVGETEPGERVGLGVGTGPRKISTPRSRRMSVAVARAWGDNASTARSASAIVMIAGAKPYRGDANARHHGRRRGAAMRDVTRARRSGVAGHATRRPTSASTCASWSSFSRSSGIRVHLAQPAHRARQPRLHGAARDAERVGHLVLREVEEEAIREHEAVVGP